MSNPQAPTSNDRADDSANTDVSFSTASLFAEAYRRIRATPRALIALLLAGLVVTGVDWLRLHDPIPTVGYVGIQDGRLSVLFGIIVTVSSRATAPLSALVGLKPQWLAWGIGLELLGFVAVVSTGAYALARLLRLPLTTAAVLRYASIVALLQFGWFRVGTLHVEGSGVDMRALLLALPLFVIWLFLFVHLFALPGLLIADESVWAALQRSWRLATGHGWSLFTVIVLLGVLNHLLTSVPLVGPLGSAVVAGLHAGTVAVFLDRKAFDR
jgi:hypothetical protein